MEKLKMHTRNLADDNFRKLTDMFPNAVTETISGYDDNGDPIIERAIDKDVLMQEISVQVVEGTQERYQFTWPDKRQSVVNANAPIAKTLRPCRDRSVDFDNTENIYIEGDNLDALKLLQETYLGKVKMIYIDPPYNTGTDSFVYDDDFTMGLDDFSEKSGQYDEEGNKLYDIRQNNENNGQFHTDWLNMIYPRLRLAKDLLAENGVIFISIDDNEVENLKKVCVEIFGAHNFIAQIIWERAFAPINLKKHFSESHDYILCISKEKEITTCNGLPRSEEADSRYSNPDNDPRGVWQSDNATVGPAIPDKVYGLKTPSGKVIFPPSGRCWLYTADKFQQMIDDNRIWFGDNGDNVPRVKRFLSEVKQGLTPMSIWKYSEVGHSQDATKRLKELFDGKAYFDYPKPVELIKRCVQLYSDKDSIILDFFSGSATTAHAVMQLNAEDGGCRKFIMVQIQEKIDEKHEAYKAGYRTICEIGEERIRRAAKKIKEETGADIDYGFRVFRVDESNMKDVYYKPSDYDQSQLEFYADNIKPDRTPEDLLFQVMLDLGILLSSKMEEKEIGGKRVFSVADDYLIACFDSDVTKETVTEIAKRKPFYAVFRDSSMAADDVSISFDQIFEAYSPKTERKIL